MYHAIVKRIGRTNFLRVNNKDFAAILKDCAPDIHHRFGGSHPVLVRVDIPQGLCQIYRLAQDIREPVKLAYYP